MIYRCGCKDDIWNINNAQATAFISDSRTDTFKYYARKQLLCTYNCSEYMEIMNYSGV